MDFENKTLHKINYDLANNAESNSSLYRQMLKAIEQAKREQTANLVSLNHATHKRKIAIELHDR